MASVEDSRDESSRRNHQATFVPERPIRDLGSKAEQLVPHFLDAPAYATTFARAQRGYDAESAGVPQVQIAVAWLLFRTRYGMAVMPDGALRHFKRANNHHACSSAWVKSSSPNPG